MSGVASAKTVGEKNHPSRSPSTSFSPPQTSLAPLLADLDIARDGLPLRSNARPHLRSRLEAVADPQIARPGGELVDELVDDLFVDEEPRRRGAPLAGRSNAPDGPVDGEVDVGVFQNEDCVSAHLQGGDA